jgi:hypothetical protein
MSDADVRFGSEAEVAQHNSHISSSLPKADMDYAKNVVRIPLDDGDGRQSDRRAKLEWANAI